MLYKRKEPNGHIRDYPHTHYHLVRFWTRKTWTWSSIRHSNRFTHVYFTLEINPSFTIKSSNEK